MLTITYNNKKIYINIALLKEFIKELFFKFLKILSILLGIAGFFMLIGTAGASDNNIINNAQIDKQIFISTILIIFSYVSQKFLNQENIYI